MRITVFTSNQPRHLHLINCLAENAEKVYAIQECSTIFPGEVEDFYKKSEVFQKYFAKVIEAEKNVFGHQSFLRENVSQFAMKFGDLNRLPLDRFSDALDSDLYVVFGASYIKGPLIDFLVSKGCINLHMGLSPFYRGTATNFWPLYDGKPEFVGATIHLISKGLDSGDILFHALPKAKPYDPYEIGMYAVKASHLSLVESIKNNSLNNMTPIKQNKSLELRYSKRLEFNDEVAQSFMENPPKPSFIEDRLNNTVLNGLIKPVYL